MGGGERAARESRGVRGAHGARGARALRAARAAGARRVAGAPRAEGARPPAEHRGGVREPLQPPADKPGAADRMELWTLVAGPDSAEELHVDDHMEHQVLVGPAAEPARAVLALREAVV